MKRVKFLCGLCGIITLIACQTVEPSFESVLPDETRITETLPEFVQEKNAQEGYLSIVIETKEGTRLDRLQKLTDLFEEQRDVIFADILTRSAQLYPDLAPSIDELSEQTSEIGTQIQNIWRAVFTVDQISHLSTGVSYLQAGVDVSEFIQYITAIDALQPNLIDALSENLSRKALE